MSRLTFARFACASVFISTQVAAQTPPEEDGIVVTASRTEQRINDAIPHTTVITEKDIKDSQAIDLPSLLRREAGFELTQNGGIGSVTSIFMRGGRGAQTLVLIDGVRVEDAAFGTTAIQHIMLDQVQRIEIVRGNVSSLYGSGAMGGVVQIFTKQGRGTPAASGELTYGSRNTSRLSAGYGGEVGDTRFNLNASTFGTGGFSAIDPRLAPNANPNANGYRNQSVSGSLVQRLSAGNEVGANFYRTRGHLSFDNAFGAPTDTNQSVQELGATQLYWQASPLDAWRSKVALSEGTDYRTDYLNGALNNSSNTRNRQLSWDNDWRISSAHQVSFGAENLRQTLQNSGLATPQAARNVDIARLGYLGHLGAHSLQLNARTEHYSDFGNANTYFAGYGFDLAEAWRFIASTSTAFRAPTFIDLFGFGGNASLRPERTRTQELGLQWAVSGQRVRSVYFTTQYQDAITFDPATSTTNNVRKANVQGIETSYTGHIADWDLRAAVTVQDAREQEPGGNELGAVRRARRYGSFSAFRTVGKWKLGGELLGSGPRPDISITTFGRIEQAGYTVLNFTARYEIDKHLFAAMRLENALDEKYQLVNGFNTPRRGVFLTVGWLP